MGPTLDSVNMKGGLGTAYVLNHIFDIIVDLTCTVMFAQNLVLLLPTRGQPDIIYES